MTAGLIKVPSLIGFRQLIALSTTGTLLGFCDRIKWSLALQDSSAQKEKDLP